MHFFITYIIIRIRRKCNRENALSFCRRDGHGPRAGDKNHRDPGKSGLSGLFSKVKDSIGSAASGTLEKFKQTLNNLIEALAILLVTSCLIPILVILLFLWLFKLIIGIDIPLPALKAEKRNTEQTNQEQ